MEAMVSLHVGLLERIDPLADPIFLKRNFPESGKVNCNWFQGLVEEMQGSIHLQVDFEGFFLDWFESFRLDEV